MSNPQRLALFAVAVLVAIAAFVVLRPSDDPDRVATPSVTQPQSATTTAESPTTDEPPVSAPRSEPERPAVPLLTPAEVTTLSYNKGETVRFAVRSRYTDEIHVHGYDLSKAVPAGKKVQMSFPATIEGIFEIELENSGEQIAKLEIEP